MSEKFQFEKALADLEKIVGSLESGELTLDEALKKYEEGVGLTRACQVKLQEAEKKIEILNRQLSGELRPEPFDPEADECSPSKKRAPSKKKSTGEDDLI